MKTQHKYYKGALRKPQTGGGSNASLKDKTIKKKDKTIKKVNQILWT